MKIRFGTYNLENLFARYSFLDKPPEKQPKDYTRLIKITDVVAFAPGRNNGLQPKPISEAQRKNTAAAIKATKVDVLAVCEVENISALRLFNAKYLGNYFDRCLLIDGNDPRGIDVGVMIRKGLSDVSIAGVRTNADLAKDGSVLKTTNLLDMKNRLGQAAFSRDCLEVDVDVRGTPLTLMVNHFKAQEIKSGKDATTAKRLKQAEMAAKLARSVLKRGRHPIVLGDLNKDIGGADYDGSLDPLVKGRLFTNPSKLLDPDSRWTHFYDSKRSVSQLDYLLVDRNLESAISGVTVFRGGLSSKCKQYKGARVGTIEADGLEASDHCALLVDLEL